MANERPDDWRVLGSFDESGSMGPEPDELRRRPPAGVRGPDAGDPGRVIADAVREVHALRPPEGGTVVLIADGDVREEPSPPGP